MHLKRKGRKKMKEGEEAKGIAREEEVVLQAWEGASRGKHRSAKQKKITIFAPPCRWLLTPGKKTALGKCRRHKIRHQ